MRITPASGAPAPASSPAGPTATAETPIFRDSEADLRHRAGVGVEPRDRGLDLARRAHRAQGVVQPRADRPRGDAELARTTVERTLDLVTGWDDLNEFKHTSVPR